MPPPGEGCWRKVLAKLPPGELARAVVAWQLSQTTLPPLLAIDGKTLAHELVDALPHGTLDGAIVGGDAHYADTTLVRQLVQEQGAITLVQLKDNQPSVSAKAPPSPRASPPPAAACSS